MSPAGNVIYVAVSMRCQKNSNRTQSIKVTPELKIGRLLLFFLDYGKPEERPECQNSTVEFIAPAEYMSRPPQAAQYLFILDVSYNALKSGYLDIFAEELLSEYKECYFLYIQKIKWGSSFRWSFGMWQHRNGDHQEDAPLFILKTITLK